MDMSQAIRNTYDWAKTALEAAGYSVIQNPAVPPRSLSSHAIVWVEGADFEPESFSRSYRGMVSLLVQSFRGISSIPLYDSATELGVLLSSLISSMPSGATSLQIRSVELGTSGEFVVVELRLEVTYNGLAPA